MFVNSFRAGPGWNYILVLLERSLQTCTTYTRCDQKLRWMLLPSAIQRKGRNLQYGKRRVEP